MRYYEKDLVKIAKRENNTKRNYLVVDPLQGKHVPVSPSQALMVFEELANELKGKYSDERLLIIGFAETATAIGAHVAISLGVDYIQTTREEIQDVKYLFFTESHSHATEQKLVKDDIDNVINDIDRIIFVEDEVTTGNTILNIVNIISKQYEKNIKFSVASILNGMSEEHLKVYKDRKIELHYLVKTDHSKYDLLSRSFAGDGDYIEEDTKEYFNIEVKEIKGLVNSRRLINSFDYKAACDNLAYSVLNNLKIKKEDSVLVVGTEEFMYPALYVGQAIENIGCNVKCHSTTRSPIVVSKEESYPVRCRYSLCSLYDSKRNTFIYDIGSYDNVIVITDAALADNRGLNSLVNALSKKNNKITVFRWC